MTIHVSKNIDLALSNLESIQKPNGAWTGDYSGSLFLTPFFACSCYVMDIQLDGVRRQGLLAYLDSVQNDDGGFGLHVEGPSCMFTSAMAYAAYRILGRPPSDPRAEATRAWVLANGGAEAVPLWGKYVLALLNLYDYKGVSPIPPELWLMPQNFPVHPGRFWCHARMVMLPMSHLFGARHMMKETDLTRKLRAEMFKTEWSRIDWPSCRELVAPSDRYVERHMVAKWLNRALARFDEHCPKALRKRALADTLDRIEYEDETTNYIDIGPVNKLFNSMVAFFEHGPDSSRFQKHLEHLWDYLSEEDGIVKVNGYNSTELWDTVFAIQSLFSSGEFTKADHMLEHAFSFVAEAQVKEELPNYEHYFRHRCEGGWPFSNNPHGWPITDCTAEGLKVCLLEERRTSVFPVEPSMLEKAVDLILSFQNKDGGFASYELTRGTSLLELLNTSDVFRDIMVDYSYVECTSSCIQGLALFHQRFPGYKSRQVTKAIRRARDFILSKQRRDGSFEGSWGICFTYGTWFGVKGLLAAGVPVTHGSIRKACDFLRSKQLEDGGWGESWRSCLEGRYISTGQGQVVMTSWALLTLLEAEDPNMETIERGISFLCRRQRRDGSWPREHLAGIFNKTCTINYDNYRNYFPLWALSLYRNRSKTKGGRSLGGRISV